jgi:hypothetical protein
MTDPVSPEFRDKMNDLARQLDRSFNQDGVRRVGFALLTFNFGDESRVNYISNADRADMLATMKAFVARAEGLMVDAPRSTQ